MSPVSFNRELATCLAEILPPGFTATALVDQIRIAAPDGFDVTIGSGAAAGDSWGSDRACEAAVGILSVAQDVVSETTRMPWPRLPGPRLEMALPGSRIDGNILHAWFGDESDPVLKLRPISLEGSS